MGCGIAKIEHAVAGGVQVNGQPARGEEGGLRVIGVPVIAAGHAFGIHLAGERGGLVASHPRLARPHRKASAIERQIAHLLAAAPDSFAGFRRKAHGEPVVAGGKRGDGQLARIPIQPGHRSAARAQRDAVAKALPFQPGKVIGGLVLDAKIAA